MSNRLLLLLGWIIGIIALVIVEGQSVADSGLLAQYTFDKSDLSSATPCGPSGGPSSCAPLVPQAVIASGVIPSTTFGPDRFGVPGRALLMSGASANTYFTASVANLPFGSASRSVTTWAQCTRPVGYAAETTLVQFGVRQPNSDSSLIELHGQPYFTGYWADLATQTGKSLCDGAWHHVAYTYQSTSSVLTLFLDGEPQGVKVISPVLRTDSSAALLSVGWHLLYNLDGVFSGSIDDIKVWGRAITAGEVGEIYQADSAIPSFDTGLLAQYTFDKSDLSSATPCGPSGGPSSCAPLVPQAVIASGVIPSTTFGPDRFGVPGRALLMSGASANTYFTASVANLPFGSASRSVTTWAQCTRPVGYAAETTLVQFGVRQPNSDSSLIELHGQPYFTGYWADLATQTGKSLCDGAWHHVAYTYQSTSSVLTLFLDGEPQGVKVISPVLRTDSAAALLSVGWHLLYNLDGVFSGSIDDIKVWGRTLSSTEVAKLFQVEFAGNTAASGSDSAATGEVPPWPPVVISGSTGGSSATQGSAGETQGSTGGLSATQGSTGGLSVTQGGSTESTGGASSHGGDPSGLPMSADVYFSASGAFFTDDSCTSVSVLTTLSAGLCIKCND